MYVYFKSHISTCFDYLNMRKYYLLACNFTCFILNSKNNNVCSLLGKGNT